MTTETDKLVEMARERGAFYSAAARGWLTFRPDMLADFRAAIIADLAADVEQDGFRLVSVNAGFTELMEALDRADRKGYMPDAICNAYEGFEYRDPATTVAALKAERDAALARVAELEAAALEGARRIESLKRECSDPESPIAIQNARYMNVSYFLRSALTKGQP